MELEGGWAAGELFMSRRHVATNHWLCAKVCWQVIAILVAAFHSFIKSTLVDCLLWILLHAEQHYYIEALFTRIWSTVLLCPLWWRYCFNNNKEKKFPVDFGGELAFTLWRWDSCCGSPSAQGLSDFVTFSSERCKAGFVGNSLQQPWVSCQVKAGQQ